MRQLLWKEWHEQSWKLMFFGIVLIAFTGIGLHTRIVPDESLIAAVCLPAIVLLPLLTASGLVPAERNDGTLESMAALPVTMRQILIVKLMTGLSLCVGPLLLALLTSLIVSGGRENAIGWTIGFFGRSMLSTAALFIWMFAASIRLPSEARAAMVSIGLAMIWAMISRACANEHLSWLDSISPFSFIVAAIAPGEHGVGLLVVDLLVESAIGLMLCVLAAGQIGKWEQLAE